MFHVEYKILKKYHCFSNKTGFNLVHQLAYIDEFSITVVFHHKAQHEAMAIVLGKCCNTVAPEGLACQRPGRCYASYEGLRPFSTRRA